ncbi:metallophosphoesterase family protein [Salmonirosea aquatica]|uniref:Phosphoesterase n=1 Tax=Salmonirosea aquatica TaxID=2654236 RepID=A0A7C9BLP7_9BACT|nr:YfcE family phosphodiesterase [Cytophagaceae bacterium SJW1-29]
MKRIGLISDTHSHLDEAVFLHFKNCDEIWHAGDVGHVDILNRLEAYKPLRVVYGNIDGKPVQLRSKENLHFELEGFHVWMTHIGGAPPRYNPTVRPELRTETPDIFVCGHSHILRVLRDPALNNMLYLNPGAAGKEGFHKMRTLLRFSLDSGKIKAMEVVELGLRGAIQL